MKAGSLDRRVTIQKPTTTQDNFGGETVTWKDIKTVWASKRDLIGREFFEAGAENSEVETTWRIRWQPSITIKSKYRIKERVSGDTHEIVTPPMEVGRRDAMELRTKRVT